MGNTSTLKLLVFIGLSMAISACATAPTPVPPARPAKVAVVLGAGAAKGFAHVGVLKVLEAQKVPIHMVVGTSAGSFVGSLYAYGYDAYALQRIALSLEKSDVAELIIPDNGFLKGDRLRNFINAKVNGAPLEKLKIPFHAVATNIKTGGQIVFNSGNTGMAVQASCSVPGIFQPARFSGTSYVDGGVVNPLAVDVARQYGADVVIAVDITSDIDSTIPTGIMETIMKSVEIMYNKISRIPITQADVVVKPSVGFVGSADFSRRNEAIMEGERAAMAAMPAINGILAKLRQEGRLP
ncbi:patatin-like phospholipase family protein [Geomobilimonas luticola]|uniref:Patatin-like phospholipase family protein n=1 Tax=Geomobilimonas luticola TaxID=1114878 RepID=A0ABS5SCX6_9BACT|nr:patatin-like phospholipase family protein [Geomobilimonas luticola]MBT0653229.1 patatin-like phospholipase family protein [Geomobilimonas luticola]